MVLKTLGHELDGTLRPVVDDLDGISVLEIAAVFVSLEVVCVISTIVDAVIIPLSRFSFGMAIVYGCVSW